MNEKNKSWAIYILAKVCMSKIKYGLHQNLKETVKTWPNKYLYFLALERCANQPVNYTDDCDVL